MKSHATGAWGYCLFGMEYGDKLFCVEEAGSDTQQALNLCKTPGVRCCNRRLDKGTSCSVWLEMMITCTAEYTLCNISLSMRHNESRMRDRASDTFSTFKIRHAITGSGCGVIPMMHCVSSLCVHTSPLYLISNNYYSCKMITSPCIIILCCSCLCCFSGKIPGPPWWGRNNDRIVEQHWGGG